MAFYNTKQLIETRKHSLWGLRNEYNKSLKGNLMTILFFRDLYIKMHSSVYFLRVVCTKECFSMTKYFHQERKACISY